MAWDPEGVDRKYKCFQQCIMEGLGNLDASGKLDMAKMEAREHVTASQIGLIKNCNQKFVAIADPCEYVFRLSNCVKVFPH